MISVAIVGSSALEPEILHRRLPSIHRLPSRIPLLSRSSKPTAARTPGDGDLPAPGDVLEHLGDGSCYAYRDEEQRIVEILQEGHKPFETYEDPADRPCTV